MESQRVELHVNGNGAAAPSPPPAEVGAGVALRQARAFPFDAGWSCGPAIRLRRQRRASAPFTAIPTLRRLGVR